MDIFLPVQTIERLDTHGVNGRVVKTAGIDTDAVRVGTGYVE